MPQDYTQPLPVQSVLNDESYINGDYNHKSNALDTLESHNLQFLDNERQKGEKLGPYEYAQEVLNLRSGIRNKRFEALNSETSKQAVNLSKEFDVPFDQVSDVYEKVARDLPVENANPGLLSKARDLYNWHLDQNVEIKKYAQNTSDSPFSTRMMKNAQGFPYGETKIFNDGKGNTMGVFKFDKPQADDADWISTAGKVVGNIASGGFFRGVVHPGRGKHPEKDQTQPIPLKTDVGEELGRLNIEKTKKTEEMKSLADSIALSKKSIDVEGSSQEQMVLQQRSESLGKELEKIDQKIAKYSDGDKGLQEYLHDQMIDKALTDPGLRERIPGGSSFDYGFTADTLIGVAKGANNIAAAANLMVGNEETAKTLAQRSEEFDLVQSVYGLGPQRNSTTMQSLLLTTASDQIPLLTGQMAIGKLVSAVASKAISPLLSKSVSAAAGAVSEAEKAAKIAVASQRWGAKVGAVIGSLPTSAQDAASNLANIYNQVDSFEQQAATMEGEERGKLLLQAQQLEDNAAKLFLGHFASTAALEYLPTEHFLKRFADDIPLGAKAIRYGMTTGTPAERTAAAMARHDELQSNLNKLLTSKLGTRTMEGLAQGSSEAITEFTQVISDNTIAKQFYDENRELLEGWSEASLAGFFLGGAIGFGANVTPKHALITAMNRHNAEQDSAKRAVIEQTRGWAGMALEDGTIAAPVNEVVKQRADGKFIVDDPALPADAPSSPEFNDPEEAKEWASNRWENYGKQKIMEVFGNTDFAKANPEEFQKKMADVLKVEGVLARGSANGASKETVWRSLSQAVRFQESPEATARMASALPYLDVILGNAPSKLREELDAYQKQVNEYVAQNDPEAPKPRPSAELQVALNFVDGSLNEQVAVEYPNTDVAHRNILSAIPKMPDQQLEADILSRKDRIDRLSSGMTDQQMRDPRGPIMKMYREQQAAFDERNRRKANQGPQANAPQGGNQGTPQAGVQQTPSGQTDVSGETTLNQGPSHAMNFKDPVSGEETIDWVASGKKTSTTRNWGKDLPKVGDVINFNKGGKSVPVKVKSVEKVGDLKKRTGESFPDALSQGEGWTSEQMSQMYNDPKHRTVKDSAHKVTFERVAESDVAPENPLTHFPKSFQEFIKETEAKIDAYNKALLGQPTTPQKEVNESTSLLDMLTAGQKGKSSFNIPTTDIHDAAQTSKLAKRGEAVKSEPKEGDAPERSPLENPDGTLNVEQFLSTIPEGTPIGNLAALLRETLPLIDAENRTMRFNISKEAGTSGIQPTDASMVVGDGPGSYDTLGQNTTVAEILGNMLPKMVDIIIKPKMDAIKKNIAGRKPLSKENQKSEWRGGRLNEQAGSPSAEEMRAVFEIAMPGAFATKPGTEAPVRTAQEMKRLVVRGELARINKRGDTHYVPESNELMDAIADGQASIHHEPPGPQTNTLFHVQKTADNRMIFWERTDQGWEQVPVSRKAFPREMFTESTTIGKQAALYLRQVVSHGHFDALFGHTVEDVKGKTFYDGLADTPLTKAQYKEKYARQSEAFPPWEMTTFSRFLAGMIGNPDFSMSMDKGMNWALPIPARESSFRAVVGEFLGANNQTLPATATRTGFGSAMSIIRAGDTGSVDSQAIVGASMLAANAKKYKDNLKNGAAPGLPGPTPLRVTTQQHQARLEAEAAVPGFADKRYQDSTGSEKNLYYDEDGNPADPQNADLQSEASDMGQNVRMERTPTEEYTPTQGRIDQKEGFTQSITPVQRHIAEQELESDVSDGLTREETAENNARIAEETHSFFALQLAQAEKTGSLKVKRVPAKGERAIGLLIKRMKLDKKTGTEVLGPDVSPQAQLTHVLNSDAVTKKEIDKLIKSVRKYLPQEVVDEIAAEFFKTQKASIPFQEKRKQAVDAAYAAHKESMGGRKRLTAEEKTARNAMVEQAKADALASITPEGYDPSLFVAPSSEMFDDKVDTGGQDATPYQDPTKLPIQSAKNRDVTMASTDGGYTEKELSNYINSMPYPRLNMVHDSLVQLAKVFGVPLQDKDTYSNSKKQIRIKTDSLLGYGSLETALYALSKMANPQAISDYLVDVGFPGNPSIAKVAAMVRTDPSLISDMHALASGLMDSLAFGLKEQGKRVMLKSDADIFGYGEKDQDGFRKGELQPRVTAEPGRIGRFGKKTDTVVLKTREQAEEEVAGPYVAMDADSMFKDPANVSDKTYKNAAAKSFRMRPTRFSVSGASATAVHTNGIIPFFTKNDGDRVEINGDKKWHALGGKSVNETFQELAATFSVNADSKALSQLYKDLWRQVFTTTPQGMQALKDIKDQVNATRKNTGTNTPLVSPETPDTQENSPAAAISQLINEYIPSGEKAKKTQKDLSETKPQEDTTDYGAVSDAEVGLDQPNLQGTPRAAYSGDKTRLITVYKSGDPTSLIHEMVHWMRGTRLKDGTTLFQNALGDSYAPFMEWASEGGKHDRKTKKGLVMLEERIALGAEEYLRAVGNEDSRAAEFFFKKMGANNPTLVMAFKKVGNMFRRIYEGLKEMVQLSNEAARGYDALFGATETITPSYSKPIELTLEQIKTAKVKENAMKLVAAAEALGAQVTEQEAQEAIEAEEAMEGAELMGNPQEGGPTTPDDPETMLYQTIPPGLGAIPATYTPTLKDSLRVLFRKGQKGFSRWFVATQGMPWEVFNVMQIKLNGKRQTMETEYIKYSKALEKAMKKHLGKTTTYGAKRSDARGQLHRQVNDYLSEKRPATRSRLLAGLPTPELRTAAATIRTHVDALSDLLVHSGIAQGRLITVINNNKGSYLHRSYEIITDPDRVEKLQNGNLNLLYRSAIQSIIDTRSISEADAVAVANRILEAGAEHQEKLGSSSPMARGVGVLMHEKNPFPDLTVARDILWGFKEDPIFNYQNTVKQMGTLLSMNGALTDLLNYGTAGTDPLIVPAYQPNSSKTKSLVPFFGITDAADPVKDPIRAHVQSRLAGWKTTPEVAQYVRELLTANQAMAEGTFSHISQAINFANGAFKKNATIFNWETGLRNFYSSTLTMLANGHGGPMNWSKAVKLVWNQGFGIENTPENAAIWEELQKYDIAEEATIAELKDFAKRYPDADKIYERFLGGTTDMGKLVDELSRSGKSLLLGFQQGSMSLYNGFDVIAKIAAYLGEKSNVKSMFPNMTEAEVQEEASKRTHLSMFSFDMNPKLVTALRTSQPIFAPFISFVWAMGRTSVNILKMGMNDVYQGGQRVLNGVPGGAWQAAHGAKRLASFSSVAYMGEAARQIMMSVLGWEEEDIDRLREMVNPYDKNGTLIPLSHKHDEKVRYINMSNILPYSYVMDAVMSAFRGDQKSAGEKIYASIQSLASPFLSEQYVTSGAIAALKGENRYGEELNGFAQHAAEIVRPLIPGHIQNLMRLNVAPQGTDFGRWVGTMQESSGIRPHPMSSDRKILLSLGIKTSELNKDDLVRWKAQDWIGDMKIASSQFVQLTTTTNQIQKEQWDARLSNAIKVQEETIWNSHRLLEGMESSGMLKSELKDILKQVTERSGHVSGNKLNSEQIHAMLTSGIMTPRINMSEQQYKNAIDAVEKSEQPERLLWLEAEVRDGRIQVTPGR